MKSAADLKRLAAEASLQHVEDGMVLGLGTGSTAALMVEALGRRVQDGLRIVGIPTSDRTAQQAAALGIRLVDFGTHPAIDLTIDGADEVHTGTLDLIKGLGGALLREKIVAAASRRMTVIVDGSKLVPELGRTVRLPVEIVRFGWQATAARLRDEGADAHLRGGSDDPFHTDGGNLIMDCAFPAIPDPAGLQSRLKSITGVVETGLFIGIATTIIAGTPDGLKTLERP
jgi:ribose 5-phosphate isomerase A